MNPKQIPNILTISRFIFAAIIMVALAIEFPYSKLLALVFFVVGSITDGVDGYLARNVYGVSNFGKLMDPLADKVMVCAVLVGLVEIHLPYGQGSLVPAYMVVLIIAREFLVTGLRLVAAGTGEVIAAGSWGKHKTVWQIIAIIIVLLGLTVRMDFMAGSETATLQRFDFVLDQVAVYSMGLVCLITVWSGWVYFRNHTNLISENL